MSLFKIECLVRGTKLANVLIALDGQVAELAVQPITEKKQRVVAKPDRNRKGQNSTSSDTRQLVIEAIKVVDKHDFRVRDLVSLTAKKGLSRSATYQAVKDLCKHGAITKTGTGSATVYHRRAA